MGWSPAVPRRCPSTPRRAHSQGWRQERVSVGGSWSTSAPADPPERRERKCWTRKGLRNSIRTRVTRRERCRLAIGPHPLPPSPPCGEGGTKDRSVVPPLHIVERGTGGEDWGEGMRTKSSAPRLAASRAGLRYVSLPSRRENTPPATARVRSAKTA